nr:unnamed protein product [Haemonchus contortus]
MMHRLCGIANPSSPYMNGDEQRPTSLHPAPPSGWMHGKDHLQTAPDFLKNRVQQSQQNGDEQRPTSLHPAPPSGWMHGKDHLQTAPDFLKNRVQQSQQVQDDRNYGVQAEKLKTEECNDKGDRESHSRENPPPPS